MFKVEKSQMCQRLLLDHYPKTCLVGDVKQLLHQEPAGDTWNVKKLKLANAVPCQAHGKECKSYISLGRV